MIKRSYIEYKAIRARIYLRKCGKLPTDLDAVEKIVKDEVRGKCQYGKALAIKDVLDAFIRGDEVSYILV